MSSTPSSPSKVSDQQMTSPVPTPAPAPAPTPVAKASKSAESITSDMLPRAGDPSLLEPLKQYIVHERNFNAKPETKGLARRMVNRLVKYQLLDGFTDDDLDEILDTITDILIPAPAFIVMDLPVTIFGDTHGQFKDVLRMFEQVGYPPDTRLLFLGDYVDRCRKSLEIVFLLFSFKVLYPDKVQLLRGNHETVKMNRQYGFYEECRRVRSVRLWKRINKVFNELPLCCLVGGSVLTMHGGISPDIKSFDTLFALKKPRVTSECDTGVALDLMWSDPGTGTDACCNFQFNRMRNASYMFGEQNVHDFVRTVGIDMIVRAHEVCQRGHRFFANRRLCTVFSAPNYCGTDGNRASTMVINEDYSYYFISLQPVLNKSALTASQLTELAKQNRVLDVKSPNPTGLAQLRQADLENQKK